MSTKTGARTQKLTALREANRVRACRVELKRQIKAKETLVGVAIMFPAPEALNMRVRDLLLAVPRLGDQKVDRILYFAGVSPSRTLERLTSRQREAILRELDPDRT